MGQEIELSPVTRITANCVGPPGKRTFYIQARKDDEIVTLLCEKFQVQQLAAGIEQFVTELQEKFPDLPVAVVDYLEAEMELEEPLEPLFRVGQMGLGYDAENDLLVLVAQELVDEEDGDEADSSSARLWASRSQMLSMGAYGSQVAAQGRPICGNCLQPMEPEGHFCPRRNGHQH
ncbi:MAG: DUF3090 family protein [Anaerolineales bacterium]